MEEALSLDSSKYLLARLQRNRDYDWESVLCYLDEEGKITPYQDSKGKYFPVKGDYDVVRKKNFFVIVETSDRDTFLSENKISINDGQMEGNISIFYFPFGSPMYPPRSLKDKGFFHTFRKDFFEKIRGEVSSKEVFPRPKKEGMIKARMGEIVKIDFFTEGICIFLKRDGDYLRGFECREIILPFFVMKEGNFQENLTTKKGIPVVSMSDRYECYFNKHCIGFDDLVFFRTYGIGGNSYTKELLRIKNGMIEILYSFLPSYIRPDETYMQKCRDSNGNLYFFILPLTDNRNNLDPHEIVDEIKCFFFQREDGSLKRDLKTERFLKRHLNIIVKEFKKKYSKYILNAEEIRNGICFNFHEDEDFCDSFFGRKGRQELFLSICIKLSGEKALTLFDDKLYMFNFSSPDGYISFECVCTMGGLILVVGEEDKIFHVKYKHADKSPSSPDYKGKKIEIKRNVLVRVRHDKEYESFAEDRFITLKTINKRKSEEDLSSYLEVENF